MPKAPHPDRPSADHPSGPSVFLDAHEIHSLTNRIRRPSQIQALCAMGIEHRVRPDGSLAVLRNHIERLFGGQTTAVAQRKAKSSEPNWNAI